MNYLSSFYQIDRLLKLEQVSTRFAEIIEQNDLLIKIAQFLSIQQLIALLSVNKKARLLIKIPVIEVRLLKSQLNLIKNGVLEQESYNQLNAQNINSIFSYSQNVSQPKKYIKIKQLLPKSNQTKPIIHNKQSQLPQNHNQSNQIKQHIQTFPIVTRQIISRTTLIQIEPPTFKQTFYSLHDLIFYDANSHQEQRINNNYQSKKLKDLDSSSVFERTATKIDNLISMVKFTFS